VGRLGCIVIVLTLSFGARDQTLAADALRARFLADAPRGWAALHKSTWDLQGQVRDRSEYIAGYPDYKNELWVHTFKASKDNILHRRTGVQAAGSESYLRCINPDYVFQIERPTANAAWKMNYLGRDRAPMLGRIETYAAVLFVSHSIEGQDLAWTIAQPGFQIKTLTDVSRDGESLVLLDFTATKSKKSNMQIRGGRVLLDPAHHWAVREFDLDLLLDGPARATGKVEYEGEVGGFPLLKHYVRDFKAEDAKEGLYHRRKLCDYELKPSDAPGSEFRLSAYGLPEPTSPSPARGWPPWLWPVVLAIACLAIAITLRVRARQPIASA